MNTTTATSTQPSDKQNNPRSVVTSLTKQERQKAFTAAVDRALRRTRRNRDGGSGESKSANGMVHQEVDKRQVSH